MSIGEWVILRNHNRSSKFSPKFKPDPHRILNQEGYGTFLVRNEVTNQMYIRHEDDMKVIPKGLQHRTPTNYDSMKFPIWLDDQDDERQRFPKDPEPTNKSTSSSTHPSASGSTLSSATPSLEFYKPSPRSTEILDKALDKLRTDQFSDRTLVNAPTKRPCRLHRPPDRLGFGRVDPIKKKPRVSFDETVQLIPNSPNQDESAQNSGVVVQSDKNLDHQPDQLAPPN